MVERVLPIDLLIGWFKRNEIKGALVDLDDTLLDTNAHFGKWIDRYVSAVVEKNPNLDWREVMAKLVETNNRLYETESVRRRKLAMVAKELDNVFGTYPTFVKHADIVGQIYRKVPLELEGARQTLEMFRAAGIQMGLVTHANRGWTEKKLYEHNLNHFFSHVVIVDEAKFKGPKDWLTAAKSLRLDPEEILFIGDNLRGDIMAAYEIGARRVVWIESPWSVYREGEVPEGVIQVKSIKEVIPALING
ncbi:MAG: HAD family hydrolase [Candidatus Microgenomates bacterium]|jgi:FMN phosphatase YigB (HAD superfamily)